MYRYIIKLSLLIVVMILIPFCSIARSVINSTQINDQNLLKAVQKLPGIGVLSMANTSTNNPNYVYLNVSNDYKNKLYSALLNNLNQEERACLTPDQVKHGEYISLFYLGDLDPKKISSLPIGKQYILHITGIKKVDIIKNYHGKNVTTIWYTASVSSSQIDDLYVQFRDANSPRPPIYISVAVARYNPDGSCYDNNHNKGIVNVWRLNTKTVINLVTNFKHSEFGNHFLW